jgi:trans-aconitate 2-methyltransferase
LAARIEIEAPARIVDLGCGAGNSTAVLRARWPQAFVLGVDKSPDMIAAARREFPDWNWELEDIAKWPAPKTAGANEVWDVIFSNATLQWLPDHGNLFPRLLGRVAPGGALAAQMPLHAAVHTEILRLAEAPEWRDALAGSRAHLSDRVQVPEFYYDALQAQARTCELWETEYVHVMAGVDAILEWIGGSGLRPFLEALTDPGERSRFKARYRERLEAIYRPRPDGKVLFPFRRLFVLAYR